MPKANANQSTQTEAPKGTPPASPPPAAVEAPKQPQEKKAEPIDISNRQRIIQVSQADIVKALGLPEDSAILHANYDWQSRSFYVKFASKDNKELPPLSVIPLERYQPPTVKQS